jgi:hypothetical protein
MLRGLPEPILTNVVIYRAIATEALSASEAWDKKHTRPNGTGGFVRTLDLTHTSFKNSLVAVVFSGMVIEATMWIVGCRKLGVAQYKKVDRDELEERLAPLGVSDAQLHDDLKAYREVRRALVHEKALPMSQDRSPNSTGQEEAKKAIRLMERVERAIAPRGLTSP